MTNRNTYTINVRAKNRDEAIIIERALKEPDVKAFVSIVGILIDLPLDVRKQILDFTKSRSFWYELQKRKK